MGTWGTGIFEDDLAMDIKDEFDNAIKNGKNVIKATKQILKSYKEVLEDYDEGPIVFVALAALQVEYGMVTDDIKQKVMEIIDTNESLKEWECANDDLCNERKAALNNLREKLKSI